MMLMETSLALESIRKVCEERENERQLSESLHQMLSDASSISQHVSHYDHCVFQANGFRSLMKMLAVLIQKIAHELTTSTSTTSSTSVSGSQQSSSGSAAPATTTTGWKRKHKRLEELKSAARIMELQIKMQKLLLKSKLTGPSDICADAASDADAVDQEIWQMIQNVTPADLKCFYTDSLGQFWLLEPHRKAMKDMTDVATLAKCSRSQVVRILMKPALRSITGAQFSLCDDVRTIRAANNRFNISFSGFPFTIMSPSDQNAKQQNGATGVKGKHYRIPKQGQWIITLSDDHDQQAVIHEAKVPDELDPAFGTVLDSVSADSASDRDVDNISNCLKEEDEKSNSNNKCMNKRNSNICDEDQTDGSKAGKSALKPNNSSHRTSRWSKNKLKLRKVDQSLDCLIIRSTSSNNKKSKPETTEEPVEDPLEEVVNDSNVIIHCHAGSFVSLTPKHSSSLLKSWCRRLPGTVIVCPDYAKAPESPFPAAVQDIIDVYLFLVSGDRQVTQMIGFEPKQILLSGEGSGAALALSACYAIVRIRQILSKQWPSLNFPVPVAVMSIYGTLALDNRIRPSTVLSLTDSINTLSLHRLSLQAYASDGMKCLGEEDKVDDHKDLIQSRFKDPLFNPLAFDEWESLKCISLFLTACEFDPHLDSSIEIANKWKGPVKLDVIQDLPHGFLSLLPTQDIRPACDLIIDRLAEGLDIKVT